MMETALRKCSKLIQYRWLVAVSAFVSGSFCQAQAPDALQSLGLDNPAKESVVVLAGPDASHQLLVSGKYQQGKVRDLTRTVSFAAAPQGIVNIDPVGLVTPLKDGETTIQIKVQGGKQIAVKFRVTDLLNDVPISFPNQVVPIFSKFGCNGGGCHGKTGGQNGFALSLFGFEPAEDYEFLVKETRGRRIFPAAPEQSLLLLKATGTGAHGGGKRFDRDSAYYRLLHRWIGQGSPFTGRNDPVVQRIEVLPQERVLEPGAMQQLAVIAHLSDGSRADVTTLAQFNVNDADLADVSPTGLVKRKDPHRQRRGDGPLSNARGRFPRPGAARRRGGDAAAGTELYRQAGLRPAQDAGRCRLRRWPMRRLCCGA